MNIAQVESLGLLQPTASKQNPLNHLAEKRRERRLNMPTLTFRASSESDNLHGTVVEDVRPALHEVRISEHPEQDHCDEQTQNRGFVEGYGSQFFVFFVDCLFSGVSVRPQTKRPALERFFLPKSAIISWLNRIEC